MSSGNEWTWSSPPPDRPRYAPTWILLGMVTGMVVTAASVLGILVWSGDRGVAGGLAVLSQFVLWAPFVAGIVSARCEGRRPAGVSAWA